MKYDDDILIELNERVIKFIILSDFLWDGKKISREHSIVIILSERENIKVNSIGFLLRTY